MGYFGGICGGLGRTEVGVGWSRKAVEFSERRGQGEEVIGMGLWGTKRGVGQGGRVWGVLVNSAIGSSVLFLYNAHSPLVLAPFSFFPDIACLLTVPHVSSHFSSSHCSPLGCGVPFYHPIDDIFWRVSPFVRTLAFSHFRLIWGSGLSFL